MLSRNVYTCSVELYRSRPASKKCIIGPASIANGNPTRPNDIKRVEYIKIQVTECIKLNIKSFLN